MKFLFVPCAGVPGKRSSLGDRLKVNRILSLVLSNMALGEPFTTCSTVMYLHKLEVNRPDTSIQQILERQWNLKFLEKRGVGPGKAWKIKQIIITFFTRIHVFGLYTSFAVRFGSVCRLFQLSDRLLHD